MWTTRQVGSVSTGLEYGLKRGTDSLMQTQRRRQNNKTDKSNEHKESDRKESEAVDRSLTQHISHLR